MHLPPLNESEKLPRKCTETVEKFRVLFCMAEKRIKSTLQKKGGATSASVQRERGRLLKLRHQGRQPLPFICIKKWHKGPFHRHNIRETAQMQKYS